MLGIIALLNLVMRYRQMLHTIWAFRSDKIWKCHR